MANDAFSVPEAKTTRPVLDVLEDAKSAHLKWVLVFGQTFTGEFKCASSTGDRSLMITGMARFDAMMSKDLSDRKR